MALGVSGTGPYGRIRDLRRRISDCKYELELIAQGIRRKIGSKKLNGIITASRTEIRNIKAVEKAKKLQP